MTIVEQYPPPPKQQGPPPPPPVPPVAPHKGRWWVVVAITGVVVLALIAGLLVWAPWSGRAGPASLAADSTTATSVAFHWAPPPNSARPDTYVIMRNGNTIASVPGAITSYVDRGVAMSSTYRYQVKATWGGQTSQTSSALDVRTPASEVPLRGSYSIRVTLTSSPGGSSSGSVGQTWTTTWQFTPQCETAQCGVVASGSFGPPGYSPHQFQVTLARSGATYTGGATAHLTHCGAVDSQDTVTIHLTGSPAPAWNAWTGTMTVDAPYQSLGMQYCPAQTWGTSLNATR